MVENIDVKRLSRDYQKFPLKKSTGGKATYELPTVEDLSYLYLSINLTYKELAQYFDRSEVTIFSWLKKYGLIKSDNVKCNNSYFSGIDLSKLKRNYCVNPLRRKEKPYKEDLEYLYLYLNIRLPIICKMFGCSTRRVYAWFHEYNIKKSKELRDQNKDDTCLSKYGVKCSLSNLDVKEKAKKTLLEKYGVDNVTKSEYYKDKIKKTLLEKYGVDNVFKSDSIKDKIKKTLIKKYGVDNYSKLDQMKEKSKKTCLLRYGSDFYNQKDWSDSTKRILSKKEYLVDFINNNPIKTSYVLSSSLGISTTIFNKYVRKFNIRGLLDIKGSSYEVELSRLLNNISFIKDRMILKPKEIDLYSPEHKIGIEVNGNYWHSDIKHPNYLYHQDKSLLSKDKGIFLYHIFEYEWLDDRKKSIILSQLKNLFGLNEDKVYARKCVIKEVSSKEAREFLNTNHLQGYAPSQIRLGLYYNDELVSLMTFGKPRFNKDIEWELLRFCNKLNTSVVGGASKLFKYFISTYKPTNILSYSNIAKTSGKMYETLGFINKGITKPNYVWVNGNNNTVLSRYQCQKHCLIKQGYSKLGNTEKEIMENRGFLKIYDCGNILWIWRK